MRELWDEIRWQRPLLLDPNLASLVQPLTRPVILLPPMRQSSTHRRRCKCLTP